MLGLRRRGRALLNLTARHIGELATELTGLLSGAEVLDIEAHPPRDLLLVCNVSTDGGEQVKRLRISATADAARIHLQHGRMFRPKGPRGPFFTRLAEDIVGASITSISQVRGDRIVSIEFRGGPSGRRSLFVELFGRRPNLVLADGSENVLEILVPMPAKAKSPRLCIGETWAPPGSGAPSPDKGEALAELLGPVPDEAHTRGAPLSFLVEQGLGAHAQELHLDKLRKRLKDRLARKLSRARSLVRGLERRSASADTADRVRMDGELLKSHLHVLERGMESIEIEDWFEDGSPLRRIALDPRRTPHDNVTRIFDRYKKLQRARESVAEELDRAQKKLLDLETIAARAEDTDDPDAVDAEAVARGLLDPRQEADVRKKKTAAPRLPYRVFHTSEGFEVRVGRNARDNDTLTQRHARGNDLWLHTSDTPGSHVVLVVPKGREASPEDVLDAAHLAVHYSPMKDGRHVNVHVAMKKQVHKPRGAKPGLVTLSGGKILRVRMQPERLQELLRIKRET